MKVDAKYVLSHLRTIVLRAVIEIREYERSTIISDRRRDDKYNVTTEADIQIANLIVQHLNNVFSRIPVFHEEMDWESKRFSSLNNEEAFFLVDPIDGTKNLSMGLPYYSTTISYVEKGVVQIAVVANSFGHVYSSIKGEGAYFEFELPFPLRSRLEVSERSAFLDAQIAFDNAYEQDLRGELIQALSELSPKPRFLSLGSAVLTMAELGTKWDVHIHTGFKPWDIAPGLLLVREAGGIVINWEDGHPADLNTTSAISGSPTLVKEVIRQVGTLEERRKRDWL